MKLTEILNYIQQTLESDQRVSSVALDDVYNHWNKTNSSNQYMSVVVDFANNSFNGDYADYTFIVYAASVINENEKNIYRNISLADSIITQMLHKIDVETNDMNLVVPNIITPFVQKFEDILAGAYCQFTIRIPVEIICE